MAGLRASRRLPLERGSMNGTATIACLTSRRFGSALQRKRGGRRSSPTQWPSRIPRALPLAEARLDRVVEPAWSRPSSPGVVDLHVRVASFALPRRGPAQLQRIGDRHRGRCCQTRPIAQRGRRHQHDRTNGLSGGRIQQGRNLQRRRKDDRQRRLLVETAGHQSQLRRAGEVLQTRRGRRRPPARARRSDCR